MPSTWMDEALEQAAQCWCDPEIEGRVMDPPLAEAIAKRIANWMDTAAQNQRNADYYRGLLVRCGEAIGDQAYIADDGNISEHVLCAKIPELVEAAFCKAVKSDQPRDQTKLYSASVGEGGEGGAY